MSNLASTRREALMLPMLGATLAALGLDAVQAAGVNPAQTMVIPPDKIPWGPVPNIPTYATETATLFGDTGRTGPYLVLVRWKPGYMSAPHWYETDRLCIVLSGTWSVASGEDFAPNSAVPAAAGSFVHRVARTPHYDGVLKEAKEPAVIAISGVGPITLHLYDQSKPAWKEL